MRIIPFSLFFVLWKRRCASSAFPLARGAQLALPPCAALNHCTALLRRAGMSPQLKKSRAKATTTRSPRPQDRIRTEHGTAEAKATGLAGATANSLERNTHLLSSTVRSLRPRGLVVDFECALNIKHIGKPSSEPVTQSCPDPMIWQLLPLRIGTLSVWILYAQSSVQWLLANRYAAAVTLGASS